jgi:hypothetical protein
MERKQLLQCKKMLALVKASEYKDGLPSGRNFADYIQYVREQYWKTFELPNILATAIATAVGLIMSGLGLQVMMLIPGVLIKAALLFTIVMAGLWVVTSFAAGNGFAIFLSLLMFALTCCYAYCVWSRIPFATANLVTAISAVKANCGITIATYVFVFLAAGWTLIWAVAFMGTFDQTYECDAQDVCTGPSYFLLFLIFLALFFSHQVFQVSLSDVVSRQIPMLCCGLKCFNCFFPVCRTPFTLP